MHRETAALLARLGDEDISPMAPVTALRPAQQQLVSMARALSHSVKLLILDEPSAVLDDVEVEALFGVVRRLAAEGVGIIWISHRLGEVSELGDVVTVLKEGRTVATELPPDTPIDTLIRHMVGGRMEALFPERRPFQEKTVLEAANRDDEMFITGSGGSKDAMNQIAQGGLYRATFLYNPSMSGSAVSIATLIAEKKGLSELRESEVPGRIELPATTVTKENVAAVQNLGY
jgi:ABC-type multidrug transport system ATPase subunit